MNTTYSKARTFIYRNARPLDLARWQYYFENGSKEAVLTALSAYQNGDGGFGHALEPDSWNPNSTPMQTWVAAEILKEIDFSDKSNPIIQGMLRYLDSGADFNGHFWSTVVQSNNDYPHAQWWHMESESTCHNDYNPTACLAGFALCYADKDSKLYDTVSLIAKEAVGTYLNQELLNDMHTAACYVRLMEYCEKANITDLINISELKSKLIEQVKYSITHDTEKWVKKYICKPSQFFNSCDSIFYEDNKDIAEYECKFILASQLDDGSWNVPWKWKEYPEEWAVSKNWWKSNNTILNMLYLKGFGKI